MQQRKKTWGICERLQLSWVTSFLHCLLASSERKCLCRKLHIQESSKIMKKCWDRVKFVKNKAHFKLSFGWPTAHLREGGGPLHRELLQASDRSQHWDHIVRREERAKFISRQTWHGKWHVQWHNSEILLVDPYRMDLPSFSIVQYCQFRGAIPLHSHTPATKIPSQI